jgi:WD40 repeat protein
MISHCAPIAFSLLLVALSAFSAFAQRPNGEGEFKFETQHRVNAHGDEFNALAKSSDDQRLFTGTEKGDVIVWNVTTNRLERTLHQPSAIHFVAALSDPRELIAAGSNHFEPKNALVRKWNIETGTFVDLTGIDAASYPTALATDTDAGLIAVTTEAGIVIVWDSRTYKQIAQWKVKGVPAAVALLGRDVYVAIVDQSSEVRMGSGAIVKLNVDDQNQPPTEFMRGNRYWLALNSSPDRRLLSATYQPGFHAEETIVIDPATKLPVGNFEAAASLWLDASQLMLFTWMDPFEVVEVSANAPAKSIRKFDRMESDTPGRAFALSGQVSNGSSKAWSSYRKGPGLLEFDLTANKIKTLIGGPSGAYGLSVVTQDGQTGEFLTGGADGYVRLWNLADSSLIKEYKIAKPGYYVSEVHLVAGTRRAVVEVNRIRMPEEEPGPGELLLLDLETGQHQKLFGLFSRHAQIAIVDNVIVYPEGARIKFANLDGSENRPALTVNDFISATAVSANRRWLAVIDEAQKLTVFDLKTNQKKTISIKLGYPAPVVVTDDGRYVYSLGHEGALTSWDLRTGRATNSVLRRIREMHSNVDFITLANDDRWLVTAGNHRDVGIFDRATGRMVFYIQTGGAAFWVEKVWIKGKRMIVTTDTGVMYDGLLQ